VDKAAMTSLHKYKIPSRSAKGSFRTITVWPDGKIECDCPALKSKECWHIRIYRKWKGEIKGNPERCFYSGDNRFLEEHHLLRAGFRPYSMTVYLTRWVHNIATLDKQFENHLIDLFFNKEKMENLKFKATIKEISVRNLVSGDKGVRILLQTTEIKEAMKIAEINPQELVRIAADNDGKEIACYASVVSVKKENLKEKDDRAEINLDCAPAEAVNAVLLSMLPPLAEVEAEYKRLSA
jgi:hypothetical protein